MNGQGQPMVVFHGTRRDFNQSDTTQEGKAGERGAFSTTDPANTGRASMRIEGGNVIPAYLRVEYPYEITQGDYEQWDYGGKLSPVEAADARYDGYVIRRMGGDWWIAFRPEQIQSAIGNGGLFDPADPSLMGRRRPCLTADRASALRHALQHQCGSRRPAIPALARHG